MVYEKNVGLTQKEVVKRIKYMKHTENKLQNDRCQSNNINIILSMNPLKTSIKHINDPSR